MFLARRAERGQTFRPGNCRLRARLSPESREPDCQNVVTPRHTDAGALYLIAAQLQPQHPSRPPSHAPLRLLFHRLTRETMADIDINPQFGAELKVTLVSAYARTHG